MLFKSLLLGRLLLTPVGKLQSKYAVRSKSMINLDEFSLSEELSLVKSEIIKDKFKTTDLVIIKKSVFQLTKSNSDDMRGKKIDLSLISRESDKTVALKIKQDLNSLAFELRRKDLLVFENDDNPLLMVYN